MSLLSLVNSLPKAELHTHLEHSLPIERSYEIANRNGIVLEMPLEECLQRSLNFENLSDFLEVVFNVRKALTYEQDFYELAMSYFKASHESGIVYCEPAYHVYPVLTKRTTIDTVMNGLWRAIQEAETIYGIRTNLMYTLGREFLHEGCSESLKLAQHHKEKIKGISLAGDEIMFPSSLFRETLDLAFNLSLTGLNNEFLAVHTGEEAPPETIIETLHTLNVGRIEHGVRAMEDPWLVNMLSYTQIPIAMCPLSNKSLKVLDRFCGDRYVYNEFLDSGCSVSLSTDGLFSGNGVLIDNYHDFISHNTDLTEEELESKMIKVAKNSFEGSFLSDDEKKFYIKEIDRTYQDCKTNNS